MKLRRELARLAEDARLATLGLMGARRWCGTAVTVDAANILTCATARARGHAGYETKSSYLILGQDGVVDVLATLDPRTFIAEVMHVTQL
jgi:hypothetical protein